MRKEDESTSTTSDSCDDTRRLSREEGSPVRIDLITILPRLFEAFLVESFVGIAQKRCKVSIEVHDLRRWTTDRHRSVDDAPYGGGPGMVMKPEPLVRAIEALAGRKGSCRRGRVVLLSPQGQRLNQARLEGLAEDKHLVLACGRYEGVDQRVIEEAVDEEISIGDFVLSGGEVPAMVLIEGIVRLLPGVLGNPESVRCESFRGDLLEAPHYTRPAEFRSRRVPEVLRSGNHAAIARWRHEQALEITNKRRPDLRGSRPGSGPIEGE
ncbi:MAG: tRNA (guanosine(37)-N1)-methyltransferase TrmD [Myxococcota bacterium]